MAEAYQRRGLENPAIIDLITLDQERNEVVLVMLERRPWGLGQVQREQLNDKLNSYFTYVIDGHLLDQYPQYLGKSVRLQLDCVEEPEAEERGMLRAATRVAQENGLSFVVQVVSPESIPLAPWEQAAEEKDQAAARPTEEPAPTAGPPYVYRPDVLTGLEALGIRPLSHSEPERVRAFVNALYVFEIRELRGRRGEVERFFGPQPLEPYSDSVGLLREKYALLSLPLEKWLQEEKPASA